MQVHPPVAATDLRPAMVALPPASGTDRRVKWLPSKGTLEDTWFGPQPGRGRGYTLSPAPNTSNKTGQNEFCSEHLRSPDKYKAGRKARPTLGALEVTYQPGYNVRTVCKMWWLLRRIKKYLKLTL